MNKQLFIGLIFIFAQALAIKPDDFMVCINQEKPTAEEAKFVTKEMLNKAFSIKSQQEFNFWMDNKSTAKKVRSIFKKYEQKYEKSDKLKTGTSKENYIYKKAYTYSIVQKQLDKIISKIAKKLNITKRQAYIVNYELLRLSKEDFVQCDCGCALGVK